MQNCKVYIPNFSLAPITNILLYYFRTFKFTINKAKRALLHGTYFLMHAHFFYYLYNSFYVTYMVFSIPGTLLGKAMSPSVTIALGCLIWSISASSFAGTQNYAGAIVCRLFLGVGEAIFGQTIALYYSYWSVTKEK